MPVGAIVGATTVGVASSVAGGNAQRSAARRAGEAATTASQNEVQLQERIYNQTREDFEPFRQSELFRNGLIDEFYGRDPGVSFSLAQQQAPINPFDPYDEYVENSGGLTNAFSNIDQRNSDFALSQGYDIDGNGQLSRGEWGRYHFDTHGRGEGRTLPTRQDNLAGIPPVQTGQETGQEFDRAATQANALQRFYDSPFGLVFTENFNRDRDRIDSSLARSGLAFSGARLGAIEDSRARNFGGSLGNYFSGLFGQPSQAGTSAQANAGGNFANAAGSSFRNLGNSLSNSAYAQGQASANQFGGIANSITGGVGAYGGYRDWF